MVTKTCFLDLTELLVYILLETCIWDAPVLRLVISKISWDSYIELLSVESDTKLMLSHNDWQTVTVLYDYVMFLTTHLLFDAPAVKLVNTKGFLDISTKIFHDFYKKKYPSKALNLQYVKLFSVLFFSFVNQRISATRFYSRKIELGSWWLPSFEWKGVVWDRPILANMGFTS